MERAPARAMLRAVGMDDSDFAKPQIAVASSWNEVTPCNLPLDRLAKRAKEGVRAAGGYPMEFTTIAVSDGISMGHEGMRASLVSREVIADSVELMVHAERMDGMVLLAGCDKSLPGMLMAAARMDLASCFLYGGTILPGRLGDKDLSILDAFEGVGACAVGKITRAELDDIERHACPTEGSCAGMYTANTMAAAAEAMGMALIGSASPPAVDRRREGLAVRSGEAVIAQLDAGITARKILTKEAFENAIAVVMAVGGSTNAVLHLLAIAHEARVELTLEDFNRIGDRTPHLADVKPFGRYVMTDVDRIGGIPVVLRALLDAGVLHGDTLTVSGRTMAEELDAIAPPDPDGKIIRALAEPIHRTGGLTILRGSLAPEGAVVKSASFESTVIDGVAKVFDDEKDAMAAVVNGRIEPGDAVVIRYEGPAGGPGHAGDARRHRRDQGRRAGRQHAAAHRRPVLRGHRRAVHRARRPGGRPTAGRSRWSHDGDRIRLDMTAADARPAGRRRPSWSAAGPTGSCPPPRYETGALAQVRQARRLRRPGRRLRLSRTRRTAHGSRGAGAARVARVGLVPVRAQRRTRRPSPARRRTPASRSPCRTRSPRPGPSGRRSRTAG